MAPGNAHREQEGSRRRFEVYRRLIVLTAIYLFNFGSLEVCTVSAQATQESKVDSSAIQYPSGGFTIDAYIAMPSDNGPRPGIIIVHDSSGLIDEVRMTAQRFADAGFIAMAPDLLSRAGGTLKQSSPAASGIALGKMQLNDPIEDLEAGIAFLKKHPRVDPNKISVIGFGWGVWRSFKLAEDSPDLYRVVVYGGTTPTEGLENIRAKVLGHYAQFDFRNAGNAIVTKAALENKFTYYIYANVDQSFFSQASNRYDEKSAQLSWARTLEFLRSP